MWISRVPRKTRARLSLPLTRKSERRLRSGVGVSINAVRVVASDTTRAREATERRANEFIRVCGKDARYEEMNARRLEADGGVWREAGVVLFYSKYER